MRQLGKRNATRDARDVAVMLQKHGMRCTSALDYWDQLTCLHYGGRHSITDHFRYAAATLTDYWTWAGAPFAAAAAVTLEDSLLKVRTSAGQRSFLYYNIGTVPAGCKLASVALYANAVDVYCGLRIDDATDNNYVELVLCVSQASPTQWIVRRRHRTGGGVVVVNDGDAMTIPTAMVLHMHLVGAPFISWDVDSYLHTPFGITGTMTKQAATLSGGGFAPRRCGLVFDNTIDDGNGWNHIVDWVDIDNDDAWLGA
ncbi:MAG: hypothetical protein ABFD92_21095 [Planctomycetaceae bacterium]